MRVAQDPKIEIDPRYVANREEDGFVCSTYTRDDQQYSLALLGARMALQNWFIRKTYTC